MSIRRSPHAVYDCPYHLVWCCKYRRTVIQGAVAARLRALLREIAEAHDIGIEEMEVASDHVHVFCNSPPRLSIVQVVTRLKSISARALFAEFPQIKKDLWGGEFWADSYFARTVGEEVTADIIRRYIARHAEKPDKRLSGQQPGLFGEP